MPTVAEPAPGTRGSLLLRPPPLPFPLPHYMLWQDRDLRLCRPPGCPRRPQSVLLVPAPQLSTGSQEKRSETGPGLADPISSPAASS